MIKKKFISVKRAGTEFYWNCPGGCGHYHELDVWAKAPRGFQCACKFRYWILQITQITPTGARILIEVEDEVNSKRSESK